MEDGKDTELEYHTQSLKKYCHVCASIILPQKYAYSCQCTKNKLLLSKLGINVENDSSEQALPVLPHKGRTVL